MAADKTAAGGRTDRQPLQNIRSRVALTTALSVEKRQEMMISAWQRITLAAASAYGDKRKDVGRSMASLATRQANASSGGQRHLALKALTRGIGSSGFFRNSGVTPAEQRQRAVGGGGGRHAVALAPSGGRHIIRRQRRSPSLEKGGASAAISSGSLVVKASQ